MAPTLNADGTVGIDEYAQLPDDGYRAELVRGSVVREPQPGYRHGNIQTRLAAILIRHIDAHGLDLSCLGPTGFVIERDPPTVRGPDLAVLRGTRCRLLTIPGSSKAPRTWPSRSRRLRTPPPKSTPRSGTTSAAAPGSCGSCTRRRGSSPSTSRPRRSGPSAPTRNSTAPTSCPASASPCPQSSAPESGRGPLGRPPLARRSARLRSSTRRICRRRRGHSTGSCVRPAR